ncbi:glucose-6-phosphate isomerase [Tautonia plasticadhaerens]|uniref:Glucose-6-phosphate isomerase n=1 Tax=Tautonia plasticadhaerens TaxID=2527974 RepID=A0A518HAL9_9BACT|nr:glucose-6-phosphate isomerase [Tautonia plasticadhaerens]QDV37901.1 Glucose-6-phosphate isomerase [Tautonia plasticadhaerens]
MSIAESAPWASLSSHAWAVAKLHLRDLLQDEGRSRAMRVDAEGIALDFSRQNATEETFALLCSLAEEAEVPGKIRAMFRGDRINTSEGRAVLHVALRAPKGDSITLDGSDVVVEVHEVLDKIRAFSEKVRSGAWTGATGRPLTDVVSIGIGGSYLGPEFVHEALRTDPDCARAAEGRRLRFLANVDPIDVARNLEGLNPETTLVVVVSKTFTTAETMLNARTVRQWLTASLGEGSVPKHMVAVSTNLDGVEAFGIDRGNAFGFWDWVGGRYSVCSAVGVVPLALQYGMGHVEQFLAGAHRIDRHFLDAPMGRNIPAILGLFGVWNSTFLGRADRALLPYCQALLKLAPHIQQVDMESNGKRVGLDGEELTYTSGEVDFGEPGTNGQHSFYQLLHQGRVVPADFIGFTRSQRPMDVQGEAVSNHDELMANFFAQPDALAVGKTAEEVAAEGVPPELVPHKVFPGNRPSNVLLVDGRLTPEACGRLLAVYEHRTAVQGFVWGINSFDQWGVELGKVLAKRVREQLARSRKGGAAVEGFNPSTTAMLRTYLGS